MKTLEYIKQQIEQKKSFLQAKYHIKYLAIFGSVSRGENNDESDIDILVDFSEPIGIEFIDLADELEKILQNKVDLVSRNAIKPKYFSQIKNELQYV
ncbi:MAG: nucleotidyltransferase family protein [Bacteroidales bacterium]|nr:nucleotidyltransferase family protein [Bacteroidales bacterium]